MILAFILSYTWPHLDSRMKIITKIPRTAYCQYEVQDEVEVSMGSFDGKFRWEVSMGSYKADTKFKRKL
jgi:hypothetical protein